MTSECRRAGELAFEYGDVSVSLLQRRMKIPFVRAGELLQELKAFGITQPIEAGAKVQRPIITLEEFKKMQAR
jgi:hypothetical protein